MAKYEQYAEYKDSKIECLGMLPSHWIVKSLSKATKRISVGLATSVTDYYRNEGIPIIRNMNIKEGYFDGSDMLYLDLKFAKANSGKVVYKGDVIAVHTGSNLGLACIVPDEFDNCHTFTTLIVTTHEYLLNRYLTYCINSAYGKAEVNRLKFGFGKDNLNVKEFNFFYTILPEFDEQLKIANFLDHETAQIDTLIDKQQTLIKLLKEKRQAVISHAVTKGLNPNAPMKESGVEWLGDVPEHWIVKRLKYISPKVGVGLVINPSTYTQDEGVYFIFGGDVKEFSFDLAKTRRISQKNSDILKPSQLHHRDLVSIRVGYPGVTAVVTEELEGANCASIIIIRRGQFNSDWLCAAMNMWVGKQQVNNASYGAAQKQFNVSDAIEFIFPVPPESEQNDIALYVEESLKKFDELSNKAQLQIELLRERRTALISAAVTGKIDVRCWQAPQ